MNIGARWTVLTLTVTLSGLITGCTTTTPATEPTSTAIIKATDSAAQKQVLAAAEELTVDILTISYVVSAYPTDKTPGTRAVKLNIAKVHTDSARATANALPDKALIAVGSTTQVRDSITRTLKALSTEIGTAIACEKAKKTSCTDTQAVTRQTEAGQAAGAAVVALMGAIKVEQKFVAAAANVVQQKLNVAGVTTLDTVAVRKAAIILAPSIKLQAAPAPTTTPAAKTGATPAK